MSACRDVLLIATRRASLTINVRSDLGLAACQKGMAVGFVTAAGLVNQLTEARDEKRLMRLQTSLAKLQLLIIYELGVTPKACFQHDVPLSQTGAELLLEVARFV